MEISSSRNGSKVRRGGQDGSSGRCNRLCNLHDLKESQYLDTTGQHLYICDAEGATALNARWEIEVTGAHGFILKGASYAVAPPQPGRRAGVGKS